LKFPDIPHQEGFILENGSAAPALNSLPELGARIATPAEFAIVICSCKTPILIAGNQITKEIERSCSWIGRKPGATGSFS
jgi:hypothetical protein